MERRKTTKVPVCTLGSFRSKGFSSISTLYNLRILKSNEIKINTDKHSVDFNILEETVSHYEVIYYRIDEALSLSSQLYKSWLPKVSGS